MKIQAIFNKMIEAENIYFLHDTMGYEEIKTNEIIIKKNKNEWVIETKNSWENEHNDFILFESIYFSEGEAILALENNYNQNINSLKKQLQEKNKGVK